MRLFAPKHQHQWKATGARYQPRVTGLTSVKTSTSQQFEEIMYGSTLLTQQCTECGWVEVSRLSGKPDLKGVGIEWQDEKPSVQA